MSADKVVDEYDGSIDDELRAKIKDERWQCYTREEIAEKNDTLDIGLIANNSVQSSDALGEPEDIIREAKDELNEILKQLDDILKELK